MRIRTVLFTTFMMLMAFDSTLPAVDMLYVSLSNRTIVAYDTSSGTASTIESSVSTFASTNLSFWISAMTFDSLGNLFTMNFLENEPILRKFNQFGSHIGSINIGLFNSFGLAIDSANNIYIGYQYGVQKINSDGAYINSITANQVGSLVCDSSDNLYVADYWGNKISKFNSSGEHLSDITLNSPLGLAFDSSGNLYVSDATDSIISKYNAGGEYLCSIITNLNIPISLAFDSLGNLYASNAGDNTISMYDSEGAFKTSWSTGTSIPRSLAFRPNTFTVPEPSNYALVTIAAGFITYLASRRN